MVVYGRCKVIQYTRGRNVYLLKVELNRGAMHSDHIEEIKGGQETIGLT